MADQSPSHVWELLSDEPTSFELSSKALRDGTRGLLGLSDAGQTSSTDLISQVIWTLGTCCTHLSHHLVQLGLNDSIVSVEALHLGGHGRLLDIRHMTVASSRADTSPSYDKRPLNESPGLHTLWFRQGAAHGNTEWGFLTGALPPLHQAPEQQRNGIAVVLRGRGSGIHAKEPRVVDLIGFVVVSYSNAPTSAAAQSALRAIRSFAYEVSSLVLTHEFLTRRDREADLSQSSRTSIVRTEVLGLEHGIERFARLASISRQNTSASSSRPPPIDQTSAGNRFDVFLSHASEDKDDVAIPLATGLRREGLSVWFDQTHLRVGESLRSAIDLGLSASSFGIVVLSPDFIRKSWTRKELDTLHYIAASSDRAVLPIWHNVTAREVEEFSPMTAGLWALNTAVFTMEEMVTRIVQVVRPD